VSCFCEFVIKRWVSQRPSTRLLATAPALTAPARMSGQRSIASGTVTWRLGAGDSSESGWRAGVGGGQGKEGSAQWISYLAATADSMIWMRLPTYLPTYLRQFTGRYLYSSDSLGGGSETVLRSSENANTYSIVCIRVPPPLLPYVCVLTNSRV